jgi:hypothetical protein
LVHLVTGKKGFGFERRSRKFPATVIFPAELYQEAMLSYHLTIRDKVRWVGVAPGFLGRRASKTRKI